MKRIQVRIILAFIFLALIQIACGCSVNKTTNIFVYEDTNGDGVQNPDESGFPGVTINWETENSFFQRTTNSDGQASFSFTVRGNCSTGNFPNFDIYPPPLGYQVSEYTGKTPWNCSPPTAFNYSSTVFDEETQQRDLVIGLAPEEDTTVPQDVEVTCECDGTTEVCSDGTSTANAEACQPQPPQPQEPAANEPTLSGPLLTGEVLTQCDTVYRPVNLRLVANADTALISSELTDGNLMVSIGGTNISDTCGINPVNATLLTCTYPAGISSFPSPGLLTYNGSQIDSFDFYGESDCQPPPSNNSSGEDTTNDNPIITEEPPAEPSACDTDPLSFACFCETNDDPDCP